MITYQNKSLVIATKHKKEKVIAPIFEEKLGVKCFVMEDFDTDILGTFTGEVERKDDPITTVRNKCLQAMQQSNCSLGIANEGSFGSHPSMFFVNADDEFVIFIDKENDIEILVRELSTATNFNASEIYNEKELLAFAEKAKFPLHKLILRKSKDENVDIFKDIETEEELLNTFQVLNKKYGKVYVETDMRAMNNPSRMEVIATATHKLIDRILSTCPSCSTPGFGLTNYTTGLPCSLCGLPTKAILYNISECKKCSFIVKEIYPNKKEFEDPMYCDNCNP